MSGENPTGITLTQNQKDESMREGYWSHAIRYGLEYCVTGRFATAHQFTPVGANILHHAVELLLKTDILQMTRPSGHLGGRLPAI
jgi:hypothetical protein